MKRRILIFSLVLTVLGAATACTTPSGQMTLLPRTSLDNGGGIPGKSDLRRTMDNGGGIPGKNSTCRSC